MTGARLSKNSRAKSEAEARASARSDGMSVGISRLATFTPSRFRRIASTM